MKLGGYLIETLQNRGNMPEKSPPAMIQTNKIPAMVQVTKI